MSEPVGSIDVCNVTYVEKSSYDALKDELEQSKFDLEFMGKLYQMNRDWIVETKAKMPNKKTIRKGLNDLHYYFTEERSPEVVKLLQWLESLCEERK